MAKKPSKTSARTPEQYSEESSVPEVVEFDASKPAAEEVAMVQEAADDTSAIPIDQGIIKARDALEESMGSFQAVVESLTEGEGDPVPELGNIMGWGVGEKIAGGCYTGQVAVKVYVQEKADSSEISKEALVPEEVDGYPTDVEEVGDVTALRFTGRYRPAPGGSSVGHVRVTAGTLGCLVVRNNNHLCILSNNHVLANSNNARPGDAIIQPGTADGGRDPRDRIGVLESFVPIAFGGVAPNLVDAALAWTNFGFSSARHHCYRINVAPTNPFLGMPVRKCGRTTQGTLGVITAVNVSIRVNYGPAGLALFRNQVQIRGVGRDFSAPGDSGSVIVTAGSLQPTALLFAGGGGSTFGNPIGAVIGALGIRRFLN